MQLISALAASAVLLGACSATPIDESAKVGFGGKGERDLRFNEDRCRNYSDDDWDRIDVTETLCGSRITDARCAARCNRALERRKEEARRVENGAGEGCEPHQGGLSDERNLWFDEDRCREYSEEEWDQIDVTETFCDSRITDPLCVAPCNRALERRRDRGRGECRPGGVRLAWSDPGEPGGEPGIFELVLLDGDDFCAAASRPPGAQYAGYSFTVESDQIFMFRPGTQSVLVAGTSADGEVVRWVPVVADGSTRRATRLGYRAVAEWIERPSFSLVGYQSRGWSSLSGQLIGFDDAVYSLEQFHPHEVAGVGPEHILVNELGNLDVFLIPRHALTSEPYEAHFWCVDIGETA